MSVFVFVEPGILLQFNQNRPWFANRHRSSTIHERTEGINELKSSALGILEFNSMACDNLQANPPRKRKKDSASNRTLNIQAMDNGGSLSENLNAASVYSVDLIIGQINF